MSITKHHLRFPNGRTVTLRRLNGSDLCPICGADVGETFYAPSETGQIESRHVSGSFAICLVCDVEFGFDCNLDAEDVIDETGDTLSWRQKRRGVLRGIGRTPELFSLLKRIDAEPDFDHVEPPDDVTPAVRAAVSDDSARLRAALREGGTGAVDARDFDGWTALHWAAAMGREAAVRLLVGAGAAVDARNARGETPLMWAAVLGHLGAALSLINAGADCAAITTSGRTLLEYRDSGCFVVPNPPAAQTALMWAAQAGQASVIDALLIAGAAPDATDAAAQTALMLASGGRAIDSLLGGGANVTRRGPEQFTPLMFAARRGDIAAMRALLAAGAGIHDVSSPRTGHSPITLAIESGSAAAVRFLLDAGADVNRPTSDKMLPLEFAARQARHPEIVAMLLDAGADIDARGYRSNTALCSSLSDCGGSREEITRLLLQAGADVNAPGWKNQTPLMVAATGRRGPRVAMLLAAGARVHDRDRRGQTPLHFAVSSGHAEVVALLLAAGADPTAADEKGVTPLAIAQARRRSDVLALFGQA